MLGKSGFRGVFILTVVMMMMAAGSAYFAVVDFEDATLSEGDVVEDWGAVHEYLKITPWDNASADAQIVVDDGTIKAYQGGSNGSGWFEQGNNLCMDNQGLGTEFAVPDTDSTWRFDLAPGILVDDFSIDMLDYGDWFPYGQGTRTATLTAYNAAGVAVDSDSFTATSLSAALYDSCAAGGGGIQNLAVDADWDISYVEITFNGVDTGIAFDNIEFNYLCALPVEYDLIAGQQDDVGTVLVWDDGSSIFVKYMTDDPWMIEEIHLAVGWTEADIPQTKKFNPIPGQFPIKEYFDSLTMVAGAYQIPFGEVLGDTNDGDVVIAAHAVVWNTDTEVTVTAGFYSDGVGDGGTTVVTAGSPSTVVPVLAVDAWEAFVGLDDSVPSTWDNRVTHAFVNADWIWETERTVDPLVEQDVTFEHSFVVPPMYGYPTTPLVGEVSIADDNRYSAEVNGVFLGEQTNWNTWHIAGTYGFTPLVGTNVLEIIGNNYGDAVSGYTQYSNPAGLIFEGSYSYDTYERDETAWGSDDTCEFDGKNWALCGEYTLGVCPLPPLTVRWTVDNGTDVKTADYFTNPDGSFDQWRDPATTAATGYEHLVFVPADSSPPVCDPGVKQSINDWLYKASRYDYLGGPSAPLTDNQQYDVCLYG